MYRLKALRMEKKVTPECMARVTNVTPQQYLAMETKPYLFVFSQGLAIAKALGVRVAEIDWHEGIRV